MKLEIFAQLNNDKLYLIKISDFLKNIGIDIKKLEPDNPIDISDKNVFVACINEETQKTEWKKVLKVVKKKEKRSLYDVYKYNEQGQPEKIATVSGNHHIYCITSLSQKEPVWESIEFCYELLKNKKLCLFAFVDPSTGQLEFYPIEIKKTRRKVDVIDVEIDENHNYISEGGMVNHNSQFGLDKDTVGGLVWKYHSFVRINLLNVKKVKEEEKVVGVVLRPQTTKNKIFYPFKECEIKFLFNEQIDPLDGLADLLISEGILTYNGGWIEYEGKKYRKNEIKKILEAGLAEKLGIKI